MLGVCFLSLEAFTDGRYGGIGKATRDIAVGLSRRGVEVDIVTPGSGKRRETAQMDGTRVTKIPYRMAASIPAILRRLSPDVFHSQEPSILTLLAELADPGKVHVATCQNPRTRSDWARVERYYPPRRRLYNLSCESLLRLSLRNLDGVYTQARYTRQKAREIYHLDQPPGFLPNPVKVPSRAPVKAGEPTVLFLGRLDPEKNPEGFIELASRFPGVRFILAGRAHSAGRQRLIDSMAKPGNLSVAGFVSGSVKETLLDRAWVLVNTSVSECLPVSFLEAAAHRCAILSPHDPDGFASRFGYHAQHRDYAKGLRWLLMEDRWKTRGAMGYRYVKRHHEQSHVIDLHLAQYRRLLEEKSTPHPWT